MLFEQLIESIKNKLAPDSVENLGEQQYIIRLHGLSTRLFKISDRVIVESVFGLIDDAANSEHELLSYLQLMLLHSRCGRDYLVLKENQLFLQYWCMLASTDVDSLLQDLTNHWDCIDRLNG